MLGLPITEGLLAHLHIGSSLSETDQFSLILSKLLLLKWTGKDNCFNNLVQKKRCGIQTLELRSPENLSFFLTI